MLYGVTPVAIWAGSNDYFRPGLFDNASTLVTHHWNECLDLSHQSKQLHTDPAFLGVAARFAALSGLPFRVTAAAMTDLASEASILERCCLTARDLLGQFKAEVRILPPEHYDSLWNFLGFWRRLRLFGPLCSAMIDGYSQECVHVFTQYVQCTQALVGHPQSVSPSTQAQMESFLQAVEAAIPDLKPHPASANRERSYALGATNFDRCHALLKCRIEHHVASQINAREHIMRSLSGAQAQRQMQAGSQCLIQLHGFCQHCSAQLLSENPTKF